MPARPRPTPRLVGDSDAIRDLRSRIDRVACASVAVLLQGESGSGKELTAHALHRSSRRAGGPFVPVNCGAIPAELVEAELFGSEAGAYTGARGRPGLVTRAEGGTLFLDEIGDLPLSAQAALLRVLDSGEVCPVGGHAQRVDFRLVSATHRDLRALVREQRFRHDLFQRLATLVLEIPPLRARPKDLLPLARALVPEVVDRITPAGWERLEVHPWPGNVRELRNVLTRAALETDGPIGPADLSFDELAQPHGAPPAALPLRVAMSRYVRDVVRSHHNVRAAARALEISPTTVYRYLEAGC